MLTAVAIPHRSLVSMSALNTLRTLPKVQSDSSASNFHPINSLMSSGNLSFSNTETSKPP